MNRIPLYIGLAAALMAPASAQRPEDEAQNRNLVTVNGQGEVRRKPDIVAMDLGIEERGQDVKALREQAAQKAQAAIRALKAAGVKPEELQTSRLSVRREWEPNPEPRADPNIPPKPAGQWVFVVNNSVTVRTGLVDKAGDLLDAVVKAGFNNINGPSFQLRDDAQARRDALDAALRDARAKADVIAGFAGPIQAVQSVMESGGYNPPQPMYAGRMMVAKVGDTSTPVESGEIVVTAGVTVVYRFLPAPGAPVPAEPAQP